MFARCQYLIARLPGNSSYHLIYKKGFSAYRENAGDCETRHRSFSHNHLNHPPIKDAYLFEITGANRTDIAMPLSITSIQMEQVKSLAFGLRFAHDQREYYCLPCSDR
jgi:hypothetical protein